ncbi:MAG TPA: hemerythrin domain-containing protein [Polyangiaceae bacterium]|jgi:hemerythrin superfamily protein|nr:hemerythrin domain-containing protein [Polyangiaceae bacterium]
MPNSIENAASKAMGAAKDVKATFKGLTGVFKHLMEEHGKVAALLKRVSMSSDVKLRSELYPTIRRELLSHERAEMDVVYPELARYPETAAISAEHAREAQELEAAIQAVDALAFGDAQWSQAFERLVSLVEAHVNEEESEFFPKAQKAIGEDATKALLPRFEAAKHG